MEIWGKYEEIVELWNYKDYKEIFKIRIEELLKNQLEWVII